MVSPDDMENGSEGVVRTLEGDARQDRSFAGSALRDIAAIFATSGAVGQMQPLS
jgi:hypothetical protein